MRRHVQGVGGVWRDGRVAAGRVETLGREFGAIGGVNHVVRNTRMVRMVLKERVEDRDGLLQIRGGVDIFLSERNERKSVEGTDFGVARILAVEMLQH